LCVSLLDAIKLGGPRASLRAPGVVQHRPPGSWSPVVGVLLRLLRRPDCLHCVYKLILRPPSHVSEASRSSWQENHEYGRLTLATAAVLCRKRRQDVQSEQEIPVCYARLAHMQSRHSQGRHSPGKPGKVHGKNAEKSVGCDVKKSITSSFFNRIAFRLAFRCGTFLKINL